MKSLAISSACGVVWAENILREHKNHKPEI
jgi:hypothetical protein